MKELRRKFELCCYKNRDKGIPNLMLYIVLGSAVVYVMSQMSGNYVLYNLLCFDRTAILHGQIWRLLTYPLTYSAGGLLLTAVSLLCYYSLGRAMENVWGTFKFNLFYLTGMVLMDIYCLIFGGRASVTYLNLSLFLSYATLYPDANFLLFFIIYLTGMVLMDIYCLIFGGRASVTYLNLSLFLSYATLYPDANFLLFFIIPIRAWVFALFDLVLVLLDLFTMPFPYNLFSVISLANYFLFFGKDVLNVIPMSWRALFDLVLVLLDLFTMPFPYNLFSVISLANYFLFFGKDVLNVIPMSWRANARRVMHQKPKQQKQAKVIHFDAGSYEASHAAPQAPYTHRCTVCGRTDVTNPELEFRYCSRCKGYYCYCQDHINNHTHIQ